MGQSNATGQSEKTEGGCLCGAVRFELTEPFDAPVHCHCNLCRRASGALMVSWITLPKSGFAVTKGKLASYQSSDHGRREFCANCGTPVAFWTSKAPDDIDINLGSLDHPERYPAGAHVHTDSKIDWLTVDPDLPVHPQSSQS